MADRGAKRPTVSVPDDWPAHPDLTLALNGMGGFDWDLDSGLMHMDPPALEVFDMPLGRVRRPPGDPRLPGTAHRVGPPGRRGRRGPQGRQPLLRRLLPDPAARRRTALDPHPGQHPPRRDRQAPPDHRRRPRRQRRVHPGGRAGRGRRGAPPAHQRRRAHHRRPGTRQNGARRDRRARRRTGAEPPGRGERHPRPGRGRPYPPGLRGQGRQLRPRPRADAGRRRIPDERGRAHPHPALPPQPRGIRPRLPPTCGRPSNRWTSAPPPTCRSSPRAGRSA